MARQHTEYVIDYNWCEELRTGVKFSGMQFNAKKNDHKIKWNEQNVQMKPHAIELNDNDDISQSSSLEYERCHYIDIKRCSNYVVKLWWVHKTYKMLPKPTVLRKIDPNQTRQDQIQCSQNDNNIVVKKQQYRFFRVSYAISVQFYFSLCVCARIRYFLFVKQTHYCYWTSNMKPNNIRICSYATFCMNIYVYERE